MVGKFEFLPTPRGAGPEGGLVLTSVNPKSRIEFQHRCLEAWRRLGLRVVSCHGSSEVESVRRSFGAGVELFEIREEDTARALHRSPAPRLKPLLHAAVNHFRPELLFLTNSDIYPALRKVPVGMFGSNSALAFTRREIVTLAAAYRSTNMYRGGLDVFAMSYEGLRAVWNCIEKDPVAARMAFGIPGWDYFLAATVTSNEVGGKIIDGTFFWHQAHRTSYGHVNELGSYLPRLRELGRIRSNDPSTAACEFVAYVRDECSRHASLARRLHLIYADLVPEPSETLRSPSSSIASLCQDNLLHRFKADIAEVDEYVRSPDMSLEGLRSLLLVSESVAVRFREYLAVLYLVIRLRLLVGPISVRTHYPKGNARRLAVQNILRMTDFYERRFHLLDLFCTEFLLHDILNTNDLKALALCCVNDEERAYLKQILRVIRYEVLAQAAAR